MKKAATIAKNTAKLTGKAIKLTGKIIKSAVKSELVFVCFDIGAMVHSMMPKYDKIEGIDTDKLIAEHQYDI